MGIVRIRDDRSPTPERLPLGLAALAAVVFAVAWFAAPPRLARVDAPAPVFQLCAAGDDDRMDDWSQDGLLDDSMRDDEWTQDPRSGA